MGQIVTVSDWQKKFAFYSASLLRQGNFVDAGFVAAVLFEKFIEKELRINELELPSNVDLISHAIDLLSKKDPRKYNSNNLHVLRKIRDRHIVLTDETVELITTRAERERVKAEIARLVTFVWQALDREKFIRYRAIGAIPLLDADNAVMQAREYFQEEETDFTGIPNRFEKNDFNDLGILRQHLLNFSIHLKKLFLTAYRNLEVDVVGKVDSASAYAWIVINLIRPGQGQLIDHVHYAFASVLATPLELRIFIDFGSEAYMSRGDWYSFVETDIFRNFVLKHDGLQIFDTEWYSFVTGRQEAGKVIEDENFSRRLEEARRQLSGCQEQRKVITWGRLLPGFIINRGRISYDEISRNLEKIVRLYYKFEKYRRDVLKRKNTLEWVPKGI